jgi:hypothetical protein
VRTSERIGKTMANQQALPTCTKWDSGILRARRSGWIARSINKTLSLGALVAVTAIAVEPGIVRSKEEICQLRSLILPAAEITLRSSGAPTEWSGGLYIKGQLVMTFGLGVSQGYGSHYWTGRVESPRQEEKTMLKSGGAIPFARGIPTKALEWNGPTERADSYLFSGLGAALYYGGYRESESDLMLIRAAEGFWETGLNCRDRFVFFDPL